MHDALYSPSSRSTFRHPGPNNLTVVGMHMHVIVLDLFIDVEMAVTGSHEENKTPRHKYGGQNFVGFPTSAKNRHDRYAGICVSHTAPTSFLPRSVIYMPIKFVLSCHNIVN